MIRWSRVILNLRGSGMTLREIRNVRRNGEGFGRAA